MPPSPLQHLNCCSQTYLGHTQLLDFYHLRIKFHQLSLQMGLGVADSITSFYQPTAKTVGWSVLGHLRGRNGNKKDYHCDDDYNDYDADDDFSLSCVSKRWNVNFQRLPILPL